MQGTGFEPAKAQGQQILSLPRLTASVSTLNWNAGILPDFYKTCKGSPGNN